MTQANVLRLFTLDECAALQQRADESVHLRALLASAAMQISRMPNISCIYCDNPLGGLAAYVSIVVAEDDDVPVPSWLAAICVECGATRTRYDLGRYAQGYAQMTMGDVAGHG